MVFLPDSQLEQWLQDDIQGGDLTTRALGIGSRRGKIVYQHRQGGCVSGIDAARRVLLRLGLKIETAAEDGQLLEADDILLVAKGRADALHQGWKTAQNILEWSCGVTDYMFRMMQILRRHNAEGKIACTRKTIPGTKLLATQAVIAGGGIIHRLGTAESILLFANHREFWRDREDWSGMIAALRRNAPEKTLVVEANTLQDAERALQAAPDILQLDKFAIEAISPLQALAAQIAPSCRLALAGGITLESIEAYAHTGVSLLITSAPYYAPPADIKTQLIAQS